MYMYGAAVQACTIADLHVIVVLSTGISLCLFGTIATAVCLCTYHTLFTHFCRGSSRNQLVEVSMPQHSRAGATVPHYNGCAA